MSFTGKNLKVKVETRQTRITNEELTYLETVDDKDTYRFAEQKVSEAIFTPLIKTDGIKFGLVAQTDPDKDDNTVYVTSGEAYINGLDVILAAATTITLNRSTAGANQVHLIYFTSNGTPLATTVGGTAGALQPTFSDTVAGYIPYCPANSIIIGQVNLTSTVAATIAANEITVGIANYKYAPTYQIENVLGELEFKGTIAKDHTGATRRKVYATYDYATTSELSQINDIAKDGSDETASTKSAGNFFGETEITGVSYTYTINRDKTQGTHPLANFTGKKLIWEVYEDSNEEYYEVCIGSFSISHNISGSDFTKETINVKVSGRVANYNDMQR